MGVKWNETLLVRLVGRFAIVSGLAVTLVAISFIFYLEHMDQQYLIREGPHVAALVAQFDANLLALGVDPNPSILNDVLVFGAMMVLITTSLSVGGALLVAKGIAYPISEVAAAARKIVDGDFTARAAPPHDRMEAGELQTLICDFNELAESLQLAEKQLREENAAIAHELRTPVTVLSLKVQGMLDGVLETSSEQLVAMQNQVRLMVRVVDDLRTVSLSSTGNLRVDRQSVDVGQALALAVDTHQELLKASGMAVTINALAGEFEVDPMRLHQALGNLIVNATRYARAGQRLDLSARHIDDGLEITIGDRGPGLPASFVPIAFRALARGDQSRSRDLGGSGLGLSVVAAIAKAHGGRSKVENRSGGGLRVSLWFPTKVVV